MKINIDKNVRESHQMSSILSSPAEIDSFGAKFLSNLKFQENMTVEQQQYCLQYMQFMK